MALLLISIFVITTITFIQNSNIDSENNDNFKYVIDDYSANLEILGRDAIAEATQKVYNGLPVRDSPDQIKKNLNNILEDKNEELNNILEDKNEELKKKYDIDLSSEVISVEPTDSPWKILFKVKLNGKKGSDEFSQIIERNASIEGLRDPLPIAKLTIASGVMAYDDKIHYKTALSAYMLLHNFDSPESYIEATAPMTMKKCPYDPYIHHGDPGVLRDCLDTGYFHESADGSCYLCRLEGKGKCPHYGMEVFIQTHTPLGNESLSCSDHVVFADHYNGEKIDPDDWDSLILDSSHRKKYGLVGNESY